MNTNGLALCLADSSSKAQLLFVMRLCSQTIVRTLNGVVTSTFRLVTLRTSITFGMKGTVRSATAAVALCTADHAELSRFPQHLSTFGDTTSPAPI
jgi:hypothetical protein